MSRYPNSIDGYSDIKILRDRIDSVVAADHNSLRSAVIAVEQTLGENPQGVYGSVSTRLDFIEGYASPAGGDLSGSFPTPTVIKIQGRSVDNSTPTDGYAIVWSASQNKYIFSQSIPPSGSANGDLSGTYPNPTVAKIQGYTVANSTPIDGYDLVWNNTLSQWEPKDSRQIYLDEFASLSAVVTAIGNKQQELVITKSTTVSSSLTIPGNIKLVFKPNGSLLVDSGAILTINGNIQAEFYQVFSGSGSVRFGQGSIKEIYPQWWGAKVDGATNDQPAIQSALNSLPAQPNNYMGLPIDAYGGIVKLTKGTWKITTPILLQSYQWLVGSGASTIILNTIDSTSAIEIGNGISWTERVHVRDLTIRGSGTTNYVADGYGIKAQMLYRSYIGPIWIKNTTDSGIYLRGAGYSYIKDSYIEGCYNHGILITDKEGGVDFWTTSTTIDGCTIRINKKSGIKLSGTEICYVTNNTIEANSYDGEYIGPNGYQTSDLYYINLYLDGPDYCVVENNYFEQGGNVPVTTRGIQIAISNGAYYNNIIQNAFNNMVGIFIWNVNDPASVNYNYFIRNRFNDLINPNLMTYHYSGHAGAAYNYFLDNTGIRWSDQGSVYFNNTMNTMGYNDGLVNKIQTYNHTIDGYYYPNFDIINDVSVSKTGARKGNIVVINLSANIILGANTAPTGTIIHFILVQDSVGGRIVSFDGALYNYNFTNIGNTANKISTVSFIAGAGSKIYTQLGNQCAWDIISNNNSIPTMSSLRSTTGIANQTVILDGYYSAGDGGAPLLAPATRR